MKLTQEQKNIFQNMLDNYSKEDRENREKQINEFVPFAKKIILKALEGGLNKDKVNALIQILKNNVKESTFLKHLKNISNNEGFKKDIKKDFDELMKIDVTGFVGAGQFSLNKKKWNFRDEDFEKVTTFLEDIKKSEDIEKIKSLCKDFYSVRINGLNENILSPLCFYLKPEICPIVNDPIIPFLEQIFGWTKWKNESYNSAIEIYENIKNNFQNIEIGYIDYIIQNSFYRFLPNFNQSYLKNYFMFLKYLLNLYKLEKNDERFVLNYDKNKLIFTFGQRYCWVLKNEKIENKTITFYGAISNVKFSEKIHKFDVGNDKNPKEPVYNNYVTEFNLIKSNYLNIIKAIDKESSSTRKSGYRKHHKNDFEDFIYEVVMNNEKYNLNKVNTFYPIVENNKIEPEKQKEKCNSPLNQILYGPPGTGKTYNTVRLAVQILDCLKELPEYNADTINKYNQYKKEGRLSFVTFHQNFSYEDFIQGLRPDPNSEEGMKFIKSDGIFKEIANRAEKNLQQSYVIIIDEINRANISRVFGELITLIEDDKRWSGNPEKVNWQVTLPSGDPFVIPDNLYIIGTMNTADKSIALLDVALRRRFTFKAMYPLYEIDGVKYLYSDYLKKLNSLIVEKLGAGRGHDLQIGHSYFMEISNNQEFIDSMNNKVIPLLMEYLMNDLVEVIKLVNTSLKGEQYCLKTSENKKLNDTKLYDNIKELDYIYPLEIVLCNTLSISNDESEEK